MASKQKRSPVHIPGTADPGSEPGYRHEYTCALSHSGYTYVGAQPTQRQIPPGLLRASVPEGPNSVDDWTADPYACIGNLTATTIETLGLTRPELFHAVYDEGGKRVSVYQQIENELAELLKEEQADGGELPTGPALAAARQRAAWTVARATADTTRDWVRHAYETRPKETLTPIRAVEGAVQITPLGRATLTSWPTGVTTIFGRGAAGKSYLAELLSEQEGAAYEQVGEPEMRSAPFSVPAVLACVYRALRGPAALVVIDSFRIFSFGEQLQKGAVSRELAIIIGVLNDLAQALGKAMLVVANVQSDDDAAVAAAMPLLRDGAMAMLLVEKRGTGKPSLTVTLRGYNDRQPIKATVRKYNENN